MIVATLIGRRASGQYKKNSTPMEWVPCTGEIVHAETINDSLYVWIIAEDGRLHWLGLNTIHIFPRDFAGPLR